MTKTIFMCQSVMYFLKQHAFSIVINYFMWTTNFPVALCGAVLLFPTAGRHYKFYKKHCFEKQCMEYTLANDVGIAQ